MRYKNGKIVYSPSDLINFMESPFVSWLDRMSLLGELEPPKKGDDAGRELLQKKGDQHERFFLQQLYQQGRDICEIDIDYSGSAIQQTREAITCGREIIYQGVLANGEFEGRSDFLVRCPNSDPPTYEVWDTKLARKSKPYFLLQLCCYAEMLQEVQNVLPQRIAVVLGDNSQHYFHTDDYFFYYINLKNQFLNFHRQFDRENPPSIESVPALSRWSSFIESLLLERDALHQVANIRLSAIKKLQAAGIHTMSSLASSTGTKVSGMTDASLAILQDQAALQVHSKHLPNPEFKVILPGDEDPRRGLALLPPASPMDVWFDMEGYPHFEGGLEYLFGAATLDEHGESRFHDWWAFDRLSEKIAFEKFVDWIYQRWQADRAMHVYHYAPYEVSALRRLTGRHGTREREVDALLRNEVFVDLYQVVRQSLRAGVPSYSIKYIEQLYKEKRAGQVATALDSVVFYDKWLENPDGDTPQSSLLLNAIREYNKEDCQSTLLLTNFLRELQCRHAVNWLPPVARKSKTDPDLETETELLAKTLLEQSSQKADPEEARVDALLAWLINYHARENKPAYWRMFDWHSMTEEELHHDPDCLAGLTRTLAPAEPDGQSIEYEYQFNPDQDTTIVEGDKCIVAHDLQLRPVVSLLNLETGIARLRQSRNKAEPPNRLSLMKAEVISGGQIAESLLEIARTRVERGYLHPPLSDFLYRRAPRIENQQQGAPLVTIASVPQVLSAIKRMRNTTLFIQGPPGCGKTYTAARVIVDLLCQGMRVGVSSNSHKAIENLLVEIEKAAIECGVEFSGVKIGSDSPRKDKRFRSKMIEWKKDGNSAFKAPLTFNLYGGTAYAFSCASARNTIDYLFVDEAGQVAVANLAGMSTSARNVVLIGDQMQLDQPVQGSHPGESGLSCLQYLLQDRNTVAPEQGIFLGTSWRMHPDLCKFISDSIYSGQLTCAPSTQSRVLVIPFKAQLVRKEAGIIYVPVKHSGNTRCSREEANVIHDLTRELLQCKLSDRGVQRAVTMNDILYVAPYNLQVAVIRELLPDANVASVDKFQGREAPIVILSMCTSDGAASPRGIEFIFSKNRLNVALSRAQTLAIVVGNPDLANCVCNTVEQMSLVNRYCRLTLQQTQIALPDHGSLSMSEMSAESPIC